MSIKLTLGVMTDLDHAIAEANAKVRSLEAALIEWKGKARKLEEARSIATSINNLEVTSAESAPSRPVQVQQPRTLKKAALGAVLMLGVSGDWANVGTVADYLKTSGWVPTSKNFTTSLSTTLSRLWESSLIEQRKLEDGTKEWRAKLD